MLQQSKSIILSALEMTSKADPSITPEKIKAIVELLEDEKPDEILTRGQVAAMFKMSKQAVDNHCRKGDFRRVRIGNSPRAKGISRRSIEQALVID